LKRSAKTKSGKRGLISAGRKMTADSSLPEFISEDSKGWLHLTGHRIGITDIIPLYESGYSVEMLAGHFPTLSLALLHRTIAWYLENQAKIQEYVAREQILSHQRQKSSRGPTLIQLRARIQRAKAG
jgi:uncharacterized protein (DUF433 family)